MPYVSCFNKRIDLKCIQLKLAQIAKLSFTIEVAEGAEGAYAEELRETETRFSPFSSNLSLVPKHCHLCQIILKISVPPLVNQVFSRGQPHSTKSVSHFLEVESTPVVPSETKPCRRHLLEPICRGGGKLVLRSGCLLQNKSLVIQINLLLAH